MRNAIDAALVVVIFILLMLCIHYNGERNTCEATTATLRAQAKTQSVKDKVSAIERKASEKRATTAKKHAGTVLATPPAVPGDSCASAADLIGKYQRGEL